MPTILKEVYGQKKEKNIKEKNCDAEMQFLEKGFYYYNSLSPLNNKRSHTMTNKG